MSITEEKKQGINRNRILRDRYCMRAERALINRRWNLYLYYREQALVHVEAIKSLRDEGKGEGCTVLVRDAWRNLW